VALSEREQRLLDELERGLYADDFKPKRSREIRNPAAKVVGGILLAAVGISVLVFAVMIQLVIFGVIGFLVMLAGILVASASQAAPKTGKTSQRTAQAGRAKSSWTSDFFENRWDRRD
jgi:predicted lipid-binding transport protein (Tim44 family)